MKQDVQKIDENSMIQDLTQRIEKNRQNLLLILDRWYYYNTILKVQIMFDYERHFASLEIELRKKRREAKELERRMQILEGKRQRGEIINDFTLKIVDTIIKKEFNRIYKKSNMKKNYYTNYNFSTNKNDSSNNFANTMSFLYENKKFSNSYDHNQYNSVVDLKDFDDFDNDSQIPHLYRNIVKKIHPDIAGSTEEFTKYWYNVQDAYHSGDVNRLQLFNLTLYNDKPELFSNPREQTLYLQKQLKSLKTGVKIGKKKIEELRYEEPFIYIDKLKNKLWVAKRKKALKEKLLQVNSTINIKTNQLNRIINTSAFQQNNMMNNAKRYN